MEIDKIVTFASREVRLQLLAMTRSLRAVGCGLPVWVIPYNDNLFDLPDNCRWWHEKKFQELLDGLSIDGARKLQVFLTSHYQFIDTDVCVLKNPQEVLAPHSGFVVADVQMFAWPWTVIEQSLRLIRGKYINWQLRLFNAGQFASEFGIELDRLKSLVMNESALRECILFGNHDQPAVNLIPTLLEWPITNLCLPPYAMASTWANDYAQEQFFARLNDLSAVDSPCLLHWAGSQIDGSRAVDEMFLSFLTQSERSEWDESLRIKAKNFRSVRKKIHRIENRLRSLAKLISSGHNSEDCLEMAVQESMGIWFKANQRISLRAEKQEGLKETEKGD